MVPNTETAGLAQSRADIRTATLTLDKGEIRYLVQSYYQVQD